MITSAPVNSTCDQAVPSPPPANTSWYATKLGASWFQLKGCSAAKSGDRLVILSFGRPARYITEYGAELTGGPPHVFASATDVADDAFNFAIGYHLCSTSSATLKLVVGVTKEQPYLPLLEPYAPYSHGAVWADMIDQVNASLMSYGAGSSVQVWGGIDAEPDFDNATNGRNWVDGYAASTAARLLNFGAASGCPWSEPSGNASCNNGWTLDDIRYVSSGVANGFAIPEVYLTNGITAEQWWAVSVYAYQEYGFAIRYVGSLTQWQACDNHPSPCASGVDVNPSEGWALFFNEVEQDARTSGGAVLEYSADIEWRDEE